MFFAKKNKKLKMLTSLCKTVKNISIFLAIVFLVASFDGYKDSTIFSGFDGVVALELDELRDQDRSSSNNQAQTDYITYTTCSINFKIYCPSKNKAGFQGYKKFSSRSPPNLV